MAFSDISLMLFGGYLLGTISPSFILGRILKKIDIRKHGTKNAGTKNTYKVLGLGPAIITGVFDLSKGLIAMYIAYALGASPLLVHLIGLATILGHIFPFYLNFKGGQGLATATAILIFYLIIFYSRGWLPWESLVLLAFYSISFFCVIKQGVILGLAIIPVLTIFILVFSPNQTYMFFILSIITFIFLMDIRNIVKRRLLSLSSEKAKSELNWRHYSRPFAVLLIVDYLKIEKKETLILIGSIALFFLLLDLTRLFSKKINVFFFKRIKDLYRSKEYKKFSSITMFLFASFLTILLFEKAIAILAVGYLIFGDFFSKFFGIHFGRKKVFEKSIEGSLAHFNACLISGYVFLQYISIPIPTFLIGAFTASVAELLPLGIDDNFSVALLSASSMYAMQLF